MTDILNVPQIKITKWKVCKCLTCGNASDSESYWCRKNNHEFVYVDNVPFFVPDMKIETFGCKGWVYVKSEMLNVQFSMSSTCLEKLILKYGILAEGKMPDRWWAFCKKGTRLSIYAAG